jgi:hypothetical protein
MFNEKTNVQNSHKAVPSINISTVCTAPTVPAKKRAFFENYSVFKIPANESPDDFRSVLKLCL